MMWYSVMSRTLLWRLDVCLGDDISKWCTVCWWGGYLVQKLKEAWNGKCGKWDEKGRYFGNREVVWEYNELRQWLFEQRNQFNCLHVHFAPKLYCCCFGYTQCSNKHWPCCYRQGGGKDQPKEQPPPHIRMILSLLSFHTVQHTASNIFK